MGQRVVTDPTTEQAACNHKVFGWHRDQANGE